MSAMRVAVLREILGLAKRRLADKPDWAWRAVHDLVVSALTPEAAIHHESLGHLGGWVAPDHPLHPDRARGAGEAGEEG